MTSFCDRCHLSSPVWTSGHVLVLSSMSSCDTCVVWLELKCFTCVWLLSPVFTYPCLPPLPVPPCYFLFTFTLTLTSAGSQAVVLWFCTFSVFNNTLLKPVFSAPGFGFFTFYRCWKKNTTNSGLDFYRICFHVSLCLHVKTNKQKSTERWVIIIIILSKYWL